jgi:hypothetical protein
MQLAALSRFPKASRDRENAIFLKVIICFIGLMCCAGCSNPGPKNAVPSTLVATGYSRDVMTASTICQRGNTLYGIRAQDGHYVFSNDLGNTWTDTGGVVLGPPGSFQQCQFLHGFKFVATLDGRIFRSTPDDWSHWTEVSVSIRPPGTGFRPDNLTGNDQFLFYGNYNNTLNEGAHIYRSADDGATWVEVLSAPQARHVHSILIDPLNPQQVFANLGDKFGTPPVFPEYGLWFSGNNGDPGTFVHLSSDNDGIDMLLSGFPGTRNLLMEGDGPDPPHILIFRGADNPIPGPSEALLAGDPNPPDGKGSLRGSARCIALTADGNLFFISKPDGGPDEHRPAIWMSMGPSFQQEVLLEEISFTPFAKTLEAGSFLFVGNFRIHKPVLHLQ